MNPLDTILVNATNHDGCGSEPFNADLGISKGKIECTGRLP
jgi:N-acyl-D-aspartate/D-glutamate deacylase